MTVKIKDPASGKLVFRHNEPLTIEPDGTAMTVQMVIVTPKPELSHGTPLVVEVLDADNEELLAREEVELKIDITDW